MNEYVKWQYRYGDTYYALLGQKGFENEPAFTTMPEVHPIIHQPYLDAFYMLTGSRQMGQSVGRIPISEILTYYEHFPLGRKQDFLQIMVSADNTYLSEFYNDPKNKPQAKP